MIWLVRLLAVPALFVFLRRQHAAAPAVVRDIEKLNLTQRLRLTWALASDKRVPVLVRPALLLPAVYMASPIDLLPDFIPVVGKLDDKFVSSTAYALLARFVPPAVLREHVERASR